jgi:hypothetical protein
VLAQSDIADISQTPRKWCNPSRKLGVLQKMQKRIQLADSYYKKKINKNLLKFFKLVFAYKEIFLTLILFIFLKHTLGWVVVPSPQVVINLPRTYEKLPFKGEP